jgi:hypothetical protein
VLVSTVSSLRTAHVRCSVTARFREEVLAVAAQQPREPDRPPAALRLLAGTLVAALLGGRLRGTLAIMNHPRWIYGALIVVFMLSAGSYLVLPVDTALHSIAAAPALLALFGALYQILRDHVAFERQRLLLQQQETLGLGVTSHMAQVAFDKHVEFCEKYLTELHETVDTLFREGPSREALKHVGRFALLRREYAAWLPREVADGLEPFEDAVNKIGALAVLERSQQTDERKVAVERMFEIFEQMLNLDRKIERGKEPNFAVEVVKEHIRGVLGINALTTLRRKLIDRALTSLWK